ncbi:MAG: polyprenyl synthetase family protein [Treponema sp.]|nr:polyprenyl synthetase family protein [Treponema sp.]
MNQEYIQRISKIEEELKRWLPETPNSNWNEAVFTGIGKNACAESTVLLINPLKELLYRGGKRWRPLLMTLVCETLGGGDASVPLAPLVEFSHNASMIHDDIEDESDERRGKPAIHKLFGVDTAINSGSFFYFLSTSCIESYIHKAPTANNKDIIYRLWSECMRRLHLGQAIDINWHRNISIVPKIDDYYVMCKLKTGSLTHLAAELGAYAAGAPHKAIDVLGEAADLMGVGFQIIDDVRNLTTGNPGKKRGDDIVEGKKSLPVLLYMHKFPEKRDRVFYCFHVAKHEGSRAPEVGELMETLIASGVVAEAEVIGRDLLTKTHEILNSREFADLHINENGRVLLDGLVDLIS